MEPSEQANFFGLISPQFPRRFRLQANDIVRIDGKLCRIIRITDCAAVVLMNRPPREFTTRFDKRVRFQPGPLIFRISPNAEVEIIPSPKKNKQERRMK
jgi:hypothetical protein